MTGVLEHANGALSTITTSFDGVATTAAPIEVHGETGTLAVPDPNHFDGEVRLLELGGTGWRGPRTVRPATSALPAASACSTSSPPTAGPAARSPCTYSKR